MVAHRGIGADSPSIAAPAERDLGISEDRAAEETKLAQVTPPKSKPTLRSDAGGIGELRAFGQTTADDARRVLLALQDSLQECYRSAGAEESLGVSMAVEADGRPRAVAVHGPEPAAGRFRACAEPHLLAAQFKAADGLRAGTEQQVTGGVIRFEIAGASR
ncbi:MAG: hypothetical protein HC923_07525 [Myxococcales bacterium]|nr:hypothetical protein [Myxococcales bacterium]